MNPLDLQDMDEDIKSNGWGIKKKLMLIMLKTLYKYFSDILPNNWLFASF